MKAGDLMNVQQKRNFKNFVKCLSGIIVKFHSSTKEINNSSKNNSLKCETKPKNV